MMTVHLTRPQQNLIVGLCLLFIALNACISWNLQLQYAENRVVYFPPDHLKNVRAQLASEPEAVSPDQITALPWGYALSSVYSKSQVVFESEAVGVSVGPDTYDYLLPAERHRQLGTWTIDNNSAVGAHFYRPPAYGAIYWLLRLFLDVRTAFLGLALLNFAGHLFIAWAIYKIGRLIGLGVGFSIVAMLIWGLFPGFTSFIPLLMPDLLSAAAAAAIVLLLLMGSRDQRMSRILACFFGAGGALIIGTYLRPQVLLFAVLFLPALWQLFKSHQAQFRTVFFAGLAASVLPLFIGGFWTLRNYQLSGEFIPINSYTFPDQRYINKPELYAIRDIMRLGGATADGTTQAHLALFEPAVLGNTASEHRQPLLELAHPVLHTHIGTKRLDSIFNAYQRLVSGVYQKPWLNSEPLPRPLTTEQQEFTKRTNAIVQETRANLPLSFKAWVHLNYFKQLMIHSYTAGSAYLQPEVRNKVALYKALHLLCLMANLSVVLLWLSGFLRTKWLLSNGLRIDLWALYVLPLFFLLYMVFIMQHMEQRYTLPYYPLIILAATLQLKHISNWGSRFLRRQRSSLSGV